MRHTFQTIGEKSRDKDAVRAIMGHTESANDMSAVYNEEPVDDARLRAVMDYVRDWLFPTPRRLSHERIRQRSAGRGIASGLDLPALWPPPNATKSRAIPAAVESLG